MRTHLSIVLPGGNGQVGNILARPFHAKAASLSAVPVASKDRRIHN
jgi:hypothetical protein